MAGPCGDGKTCGKTRGKTCVLQSIVGVLYTSAAGENGVNYRRPRK
jgi:hypothetical protein